MAFTQLLAIGTGAGTSSDVTIAAGESITLALKGTLGKIPLLARVHVQAKGDDAVYYTVDTLDAAKRSCQITAKGVYRVSRAPSSEAVGVTYEAP